MVISKNKIKYYVNFVKIEKNTIMNSKILESTYQEIISHDYTKETNFILHNFYITNKQGNAYIKKNQGQFFFSWSPCKENTYINWCKSDNILYRVNVCFSKRAKATEISLLNFEKSFLIKIIC